VEDLKAGHREEIFREEMAPIFPAMLGIMLGIINEGSGNIA
jgi:hypothetical protein